MTDVPPVEAARAEIAARFPTTQGFARRDGAWRCVAGRTSAIGS